MRPMKLITLISSCLILLMSTNAISGDLPFLMDLGQLKLAVANTEVVDEISLPGLAGLVSVALSAKKEHKLVIVTLKGTVTYPCRIPIEPTEFIALYKEETTDSKGAKSHTVVAEHSEAVAVYDMWAAPPIGKGPKPRTTYHIYKPGPITIKVAFILPENVTDFFVCYPTLAEGKATVSAETGN